MRSGSVLSVLSKAFPQSSCRKSLLLKLRTCQWTSSTPRTLSQRHVPPFRPTFQVMEVEEEFDDGFTTLTHATTIWLWMWRYTRLAATFLAWGFRLHQVHHRRRLVLKFDPCRVQSRRLHGDVVKFWVHKRGAGRTRCSANPREGLLDNDCDAEVPDHDQDQ